MMMNEYTPMVIEFLLERAKDGKEFYINNVRHYFSVGGVLRQSTNEVIQVECFGEMINTFKSNICPLNMYELCNPEYTITLEPIDLNLKDFVSLHKEMN
jgi:hypothetical protein